MWWSSGYYKFIPVNNRLYKLQVLLLEGHQKTLLPPKRQTDSAPFDWMKEELDNVSVL